MAAKGISRARQEHHVDHRSHSRRAYALHELGRDAEAAETQAGGVETLRALVADRPDAYEPDLVQALVNLCDSLRAAGQVDDALSASNEAVEGARHLADVHPRTFLGVLADAVDNRSLIFAAKGRI